MKPLIVPPSAWPAATPVPLSSVLSNQQGHPTGTTYAPGGIAATGGGSARVIKYPVKSWLSGLPANVFGQLIAAGIAQGPVVKSWLSQPALFLPGVVLLISLVIVIVSSAVLWPYGVFQQAAEGLWLYLRGLHARYTLCAKPSEKVAIALTMGAVGIVDLCLALIALPIFLGRFYLQWVALAPVIHTAISAAVLAGIAVVLALIVPIIVGIVIVSIIAAAND